MKGDVFLLSNDCWLMNSPDLLELSATVMSFFSGVPELLLESLRSRLEYCTWLLAWRVLVIADAVSRETGSR